MLKERHGTEAVYWCRKCCQDEYQQRGGKPLSTNKFKQLSAMASGRPFLPARGIAKAAMFKLAQDSFGSGDKESLRKMKNHIAEGLDTTAKEKLDEHVRRVAEKCSNGRGMPEYAAVVDFNPMITKAFAMRYACRQ